MGLAFESPAGHQIEKHHPIGWCFSIWRSAPRFERSNPTRRGRVGGEGSTEPNLYFPRRGKCKRRTVAVPGVRLAANGCVAHRPRPLAPLPSPATGGGRVAPSSGSHRRKAPIFEQSNPTRCHPEEHSDEGSPLDPPRSFASAQDDPCLVGTGLPDGPRALNLAPVCGARRSSSARTPSSLADRGTRCAFAFSAPGGAQARAPTPPNAKDPRTQRFGDLLTSSRRPCSGASAWERSPAVPPACPGSARSWTGQKDGHNCRWGPQRQVRGRCC